MTTTSREILLRVRKLIPPLLPNLHKGQQGRVAVIGGSEDYTGAPFFSASSSALLGADMSHVICEPQAAQVIKTYSPNLMVHPYMRQCSHAQPHETSSYLCDKIVNTLMDRLHAIVVGPGLGRDKLMQETAGKVILEARKRGLPVVIDADGLMLVQNQPETVKGYEKAVLTPNIMEFKRLCKTFDVQLVDDAEVEEPTCSLLAKALGGVTVMQKGQKDYVSNGKITWIVDIPGGLKRSGGQGDTLTGTLATFLAWKAAYQNRLWNHDNSLSNDELIVLCAYGAAATTRYCSRMAFVKKGRALQASDLMVEVGNAFEALFERELTDEVLYGSLSTKL